MKLSNLGTLYLGIVKNDILCVKWRRIQENVQQQFRTSAKQKRIFEKIVSETGVQIVVSLKDYELWKDGSLFSIYFVIYCSSCHKMNFNWTASESGVF